MYFLIIYKQTDIFKLSAADLGKVHKIRIRHDNSGNIFGAEWFLEKVEVVDNTDNETYVFNCEKWLSKKKEDKQIDRVFYEQVGIFL